MESPRGCIATSTGIISGAPLREIQDMTQTEDKRSGEGLDLLFCNKLVLPKVCDLTPFYQAPLVGWLVGLLVGLVMVVIMLR